MTCLALDYYAGLEVGGKAENCISLSCAEYVIREGHNTTMLLYLSASVLMQCTERNAEKIEGVWA